MTKLIFKCQNGYNLTNVYRSFGKGTKYKKGEYYDTNGKQITNNGILLESVRKELLKRHKKAYVDNIASNIKAGNIYQNGFWRANVGDNAKVASAAEAIAQAKKNPNKYRQGQYGRWQYKTNEGQWNYFNGNPIQQTQRTGNINKQLNAKPIRFAARTKEIQPILNSDGTVLTEIDRSKLDPSQYNLRDGKLYDTQNNVVGIEKNNKLYGYGHGISSIPDSIIAENSDYIGKYAYNLGDERAKAIKNGQYVNYWTGNVLNEYNEDLNNLPKGIEGDRQGNLYYPNGKPYGRVVKYTDGSSGFYKFLSAYKFGGKTIDNYSNKFKFNGTMKLIAKAQKGLSFKAAFNKARNNGDRIFWYKGKTYNTMTSKEQNDSKLRQQWAKTHKDNSTSGGSNNVQTDIGLSGGWKGVKGANAGRFDSNGNWIRLTEHSDAPVAARGNNVTQHLDYAPIDKPTDKISTYTPGTDRNQFSANETTGLIVGNSYMVSNPKKIEYNSFMGNRQYGRNEDITQFSPWGFPGGPGTYVVSPITPGYSLERSPELVPPQVSFEPQTPEQIKEFAKTIGIDPKYISGDRQVTVTAKRKK